MARAMKQLHVASTGKQLLVAKAPHPELYQGMAATRTWLLTVHWLYGLAKPFALDACELRQEEE